MDGAIVMLRTYDLFTPEAMADPIPLLHRIRSESPVSWIPRLDAYLLTRYADIRATLTDKRLSPARGMGMSALSQDAQDELRPIGKSIELWMGHTNQADHVRIQRLLKRFFTPSFLNALRPRVRELTNDLLDAAAPSGGMEMVKGLAYPLPANVIAEILGMPPCDRERLRAWSRDILAFFQLAEIDELRRGQDSVLEMQDYLRTLASQCRNDPREDLLTMLVAAEREGMISEDEIVANCVLLLFAGHETTTDLIASGLASLFDNPGQFAALKSSPELMVPAVEEMLRYDGPANVIVRVSTEPVEVADITFPAGRQFYLAMSAANRDPEVFDHPDTFDITRKPNRHLAFSLGSFYCLGAALARMEAVECFTVLLDRFPDIRPSGVPTRVPVPPLGHQMDSMHVKF